MPTTIGSFVYLEGLSPDSALRTLAAGLAAAIAWNVLTWRLGIPASSTHGLVGGVVGATIADAGADDVIWGFAALADGRVEGVAKVVLALVLSPLIGLALGWLVLRALAWTLRSASVAWNFFNPSPTTTTGCADLK